MTPVSAPFAEFSKSHLGVVIEIEATYKTWTSRSTVQAEESPELSASSAKSKAAP